MTANTGPKASKQVTIPGLEPSEPTQLAAPAYGIIDPDYARVFTLARCLAWSEGYSCCMQGSFTRDLDLLLVPWTDQARPDLDVLVARIAQAAGLTVNGEPSIRPHGRRSYTLVFPGFYDPRFVDVSGFPATKREEVVATAVKSI